MATVAVLDYGSSNLRSVVKALQAVAAPGIDVHISTTAAELRGADRVVFPGQGAIGQCMQRLQALDLIEAVTDCLRNKPFLGICLGLQSLFDTSAENGGTPCLGMVPGTVLRFPAGAGLKVPHMGWNQVRQQQGHALWRDIPGGERFYFVHSYYVAPADPAHIAGVTGYGLEFTSAVARENLFAVQFHPEKSQRPGLALLRNFLHWNP